MYGRMQKYWKYIIMRVLKGIHLLTSVVLFALCWYAAYYSEAAMQSSGGLVVALYTVMFLVLLNIYRSYAVGFSRVSELIYSQVLSDIIAAGIVYAVACATWLKILNPLTLILMLIAQGVFDAGWCLIANRIYFQIHQPKCAVVVYRKEEDLRKLQEIRYFTSKFDVQKYIKNPSDDYGELLREIEGFKVVFVVGIPATLRNSVAKYCVENAVQGYIVPHVGDIIMAGAQHMLMFSVPVMRVRRAEPRAEYLIVKRLIDIFVSIIALVILSPVMLVTALLIHHYDDGPVFYKQVRLTRDGRCFEILKFRSMKVNAEKDGVARLASEHDVRITPVGKVIRACRIDELPQLINILMGDMTIVGPRPERPEIAAQYEKEMPAFSLRLQVKAGLTGLAQVYGRYNTEPYDKLQMDLMYINQMSFATDFKLMLATVKILFMKESTSGIADGQTTAAVTGSKVEPECDKETA